MSEKWKAGDDEEGKPVAVAGPPKALIDDFVEKVKEDAYLADALTAGAHPCVCLCVPVLPSLPMCVCVCCADVPVPVDAPVAGGDDDQ